MDFSWTHFLVFSLIKLVKLLLASLCSGLSNALFALFHFALELSLKLLFTVSHVATDRDLFLALEHNNDFGHATRILEQVWDGVLWFFALWTPVTIDDQAFRGVNHGRDVLDVLFALIEVFRVLHDLSVDLDLGIGIIRLWDALEATIELALPLASLELLFLLGFEGLQELERLKLELLAQ